MSMSASELYGELTSIDGISGEGFGDEERGDKLVEYVRVRIEREPAKSEMASVIEGSDWGSSHNGDVIEFSRVVHEIEDEVEVPDEAIPDEARFDARR